MFSHLLSHVLIVLIFSLLYRDECNNLGIVYKDRWLPEENNGDPDPRNNPRGQSKPMRLPLAARTPLDVIQIHTPSSRVPHSIKEAKARRLTRTLSQVSDHQDTTPKGKVAAGKARSRRQRSSAAVLDEEEPQASSSGTRRAKVAASAKVAEYVQDDEEEVYQEEAAGQEKEKDDLWRVEDSSSEEDTTMGSEEQI